jgi:hypothetical protein
MATKKEIAKEKAIEGGMPSDVADNIFRMQIGKHGSQNTPGTFRVKDQKTMAMSTMFQTPDPEGTRPKVKPITFNEQIAGTEPITANQVSIGFSGGGVFENQEQKDFYDNQIAQRTAAGMTQDQAIQDYRNTFKIGQEQFKAELSGGKTKYATNPFGDFAQGFDSGVGTDKKKTGSGSSKPSKTTTTGMVDTFSALDTRQAGRKAIVEGRKLKQAKRREARARMKKGDITRKQFREEKKQAKLDQATARKEAMEKIAAQGRAQRSAGKNPAITTEFDPSAEAPFLMKPMKFRKKYKK